VQQRCMQQRAVRGGVRGRAAPERWISQEHAAEGGNSSPSCAATGEVPPYRDANLHCRSRRAAPAFDLASTPAAGSQRPIWGWHGAPESAPRLVSNLEFDV
jgi:hypothetical protein